MRNTPPPPSPQKGGKKDNTRMMKRQGENRGSKKQIHKIRQRQRNEDIKGKKEKRNRYEREMR